METSYKKLYEQAQLVMQDPEVRRELIEMLLSWRSEYEQELLAVSLQDFDVFLRCEGGEAFFWLVNPQSQVAAVSDLYAFVSRDFSEVGPSKECYQEFICLLERESSGNNLESRSEENNANNSRRHS